MNPSRVVQNAFLATAFALASVACTTSDPLREGTENFAQCELKADTRAVYEVAVEIMDGYLLSNETHKTQQEWASFSEPTETVQTRPDGSTDHFYEKGELRAEFQGGAVLIEVRRDAQTAGATWVHVRYHEHGAPESTEALRAKEWLDRIVEGVHARKP